MSLLNLIAAKTTWLQDLNMSKEPGRPLSLMLGWLNFHIFRGLAGPTLNNSDLVVEAIDKSQGYFVLGLAIGGDSSPVPVDHLSELLVWLQTLSRPALAKVYY